MKTISVSIVLVLIIGRAYCLENIEFLPTGTSSVMNFATSYDEETIICSLVRGGLWLSDDSGQNWSPLHEHLFPDDKVAINDVMIVPGSNDSIIVLNHYSNYVPYSTDGGITWNQWQEPFMISGARKIIFIDPSDPDHLFYSGGNIFGESFNFGQNWVTHYLDINTSVFNITYDENIHRYLFSSMYLMQNNIEYGGLVSFDSTLSDMQIEVPFSELFGESSLYVMGTTVLSNGSWLSMIYNFESNPLIMSPDQGETWERIGEGLPANFKPEKIIEDPNNPGRLIARGAQKYGLFSSTDYGYNWVRHADELPENVLYCNDLVFNENTNHLYLATDGYGVFKSSPSWESWNILGMPQVNSYGFLSIFQDDIFFRDSGFRSWRMDNSGSWQEYESPFPATDTMSIFRPITYSSGDTLISANYKRPFFTFPAENIFQIAHSYDSGISWQLLEPLSFNTDSWIKYIRTENGVRIHTKKDGYTLTYSDDYGHEWHELNCMDFPIYDYEMTGDKSYIYTPAGIFYTQNDGEDWINTNYDGNLSRSSIIGATENSLYTCSQNTEQYFCLKYSHASQQWTQLGEFNAAAGLHQLDFTDSDSLFIVAQWTESSLWVSNDAGGNWREVEVNLPDNLDQFGVEMFYIDRYRNRLWLVYGSGVYYAPLDELNAGNSEIKVYRPGTLQLDAYPNPFNDRTLINFNVPEKSDVRLQIYNINGQEVAKYDLGVLNPGSYSESFDASSLASGQYIACLSINGQTITRKLTYIK